MLFSLPLFLFYILPFFLFTYLILPEKLRNGFLLIFSFIFYAFSAKALTTILLASIVLNYSAGRLLSSKYKDIILSLSILLDIIILGIFKYFNFFVENISALFQFFHLGSLNTSLSFILPLGLSFYTLQSIAYLVDIHREIIEPEKNIIRFGVFIAMFPKILVGPIERYSNLQKSLIQKNISINNFSMGARRFIIGLAKKVIIADNLDITINSIFHSSKEQLSTPVAWLGIIFFTIQLYYDFSGYTDMAIGLGKMCGLAIMENFNFPYISRSIQEFWQRWHISLSTWLADYIFKPVQFKLRYKMTFGGILSILITFFVSGLWHGASWNFIFWGMYHGLFLVLEFVFLGRLLKEVRPVVSHIYALSVIMVGWVFFKTDTLSQAFMYLNKMFIPTYSSTFYTPVTEYLNVGNIIFVLVGILFAIPIPVKVKNLFSKINSDSDANMISDKFNVLYSVSLLILLIISFMYISVHAYKPFLYGGF